MKARLFDRIKFLFNESALDQAVRAFLSGDGPPPENYLTIDSSAALKYNAVFSCLRVLAETLASVPVHEYTKETSGNREQTDETGLNDIFRYAPNDEMSAYSFKEMGMFQINLGGNFVCLREQTRGKKILSLIPLEWNRVTIERNVSTKKVEYKVDGRSDQIYSRSQVFHIPGPSFNGITGLSPIEYAASAIRLGLTYEAFSNNFFKNGALASGAFEAPGFLKPEAYERLKKDLSGNWQGLVNAGKPILLENGLKFNPITMKMVDAELLQSKRFQVEDICRIYRVPLHLVQNLDRATNNNIEHQSLEFVMYTMLPWFKRWEEAINSQLLTLEQRSAGRYLEFNMSGLLRGDTKSMAEAFAVGRQWGWLSVNDIRKMLNMNGIGPEGDIYLQPMNMVEAGTVIEPDAAKKTLEQKKIVDEVLQIIESRKS